MLVLANTIFDAARAHAAVGRPLEAAYRQSQEADRFVSNSGFSTVDSVLSCMREMATELIRSAAALNGRKSGLPGIAVKPVAPYLVALAT